MKVAGLQMDLAWEDPDENFQRAAAQAETAVQNGADLLVLPEMFNTGFSMEAKRVAPHAERTREFLSVLARRHEVWVIGGYAEPFEPRPRNACSVIDPSGQEALRYHKIHPFSLAHEDEHYCGGESLGTVTIHEVRVTPLICYDLRFPEPFRAAAGETDLFVVIANWPEKRRDAWRTLLRARAIENQCFVLGVNRVGEGGGLPHSGDSALIEPLGIVSAERSGEVAIVGGEITAGAVADVRSRFSFLRDRREKVYRELRARRSDHS